MKKALLISLATILFCGTSFAWSTREHATVAAIAESHLTPKAKELIKEYLGAEDFLSKGKATPFDGLKVFGENLMTVYNGQTVYQK